MVEPSETDPSLLEAESRGGDIGEAGYAFQAGVLLGVLPRWLAAEGFSDAIREAMGDIEARFFDPHGGQTREFIEAKNHSVSPTEFWREIGRMQALDGGSPDTYRRFTLACTGLSEDVRKVVSGLRRIRGPEDFYAGTKIAANSLEGLVAIVEGVGHTRDEAAFLAEKVEIVADWSPAQQNAEAIFKHRFSEEIAGFDDISPRLTGGAYRALSDLFSKRRNVHVTRREIERLLDSSLRPVDPLLQRPVHVHTVGVEGPDHPRAIRIDWREFFIAKDGAYPTPDKWESGLLGPLRRTKDWILAERGGRRISLTGERRLSSAIAIGTVFSAVSGFAVEMNHRGEPWRTDDHAGPETPAFSCLAEGPDCAGEDLIVVVSIGRDIAPNVSEYQERAGMSAFPKLSIRSDSPIVSPDHANAAVKIIKDRISEVLSRVGGRQIHLFYAGPSHLALFLGHRLNAVAPIQCYEWKPGGSYSPTCRLWSS